LKQPSLTLSVAAAFLILTLAPSASLGQTPPEAPPPAPEGTPEAAAEGTASPTAAAPAAAPGQETAPKPGQEPGQGFFVESINVNVVNVEVVVTDKKGVPISGLTRDDFELYEEGRQVPITNFYAVKGGKPVEEKTAAAAPAPPGPQPPRLQELDIPEDQRLHLILFIDHFNIHPLNRNRVIRDLRQFINQTVRTGDRVMLVSYTRSIKVEQPFTTDPRLISAALSGLEKVSGHATLRDSERQDALERIEEARDAFTATSYARVYADSVFNDLTFTVRGLKQFVESLAGLPGRKMVVHVSDGIPMVAGQEVFQYVDSKFPNSSAINEGFSYDASRMFQELVAMANANRVTFYPLDAAGLRTFTSVSASQAGAAGRGVLVDSTLIHNLQDSLHFIANGTGGRAILNRNRPLAALQEVAQDFRDYYSLGFNPAHAGTGRLYELKVKLRDKDIKADLRYRESYRDKSVETQMSDGTLASLEFKYESNQHDLKLEIDNGEPRDEGRFYLVPVRVRIPLKKVTLVPAAETLEGRVRLFIAALDYEGAKSPVQESSVPISIPAGQFDPEGDQVFVYSMELLMRRGGHEVAVGLRDDLSGETSFLRQRVNVGGQS
jgi:VWFA-related protein